MVVGKFDLRLTIGITLAETNKGQGILLFGSLSGTQQIHAQNTGIKVNGAAQVANPQHGVQKHHDY
jgi:hypothetical protein